MEIPAITPAQHTTPSPLNPILPPLLVGLHSPAMGSGKTTFADFMMQHSSFVRVPLASTLKNMFGSFLVSVGFSDFDAREIIADPELKETPMRELNGKTPRYAMQTLGTEWGRDLFGEDLWVNATLARAKAEIDKGNSVVIDDVRFPNEADAIKAAGGFMVRIHRAGAKITLGHSSEGALEGYPFDYQVSNDSSLEVLRLDALNCIGALLTKRLH